MSDSSQVTFLSALIHLEKRLRQADSVDVLSYRLANETRNLIQYDQLMVWSYARTGIGIRAVSGVDRVGALSPFAQKFQNFIRTLRAEKRFRDVVEMEREEFLAFPGGDLLEDLPWEYMLWVPIGSGDSNPCAGMVVFREHKGWNEQERKLFEHMRGTAHHAWKALAPGLERTPHQRRWVGALLLGVILGCCFIPVRLSVLAPAEVVARDMAVVSPALEGIVARIHVSPNAEVDKGEHLITLDQTTFVNRLNVARQALEVVKARYQHAQQRSFSDPEARETILLLEAQLKQKEAELEFASSMLERTRIGSPRAGIAVFNDVNDWLGRPVATGERIMSVASPQSVQVKVLLPVEDAIRLKPDQKAAFYINVAPAEPLMLDIEQVGYESFSDPELGPVYPLKASFVQTPGEDLRIGARGTVRLYGEKVALIYAVLRKPLTYLRMHLGV
jgi:multidrug resistance efflux pump